MAASIPERIHLPEPAGPGLQNGAGDQFLGGAGSGRGPNAATGSIATRDTPRAAIVITKTDLFI